MNFRRKLKVHLSNILMKWPISDLYIEKIFFFRNILNIDFKALYTILKCHDFKWTEKGAPKKKVHLTEIFLYRRYIYIDIYIDWGKTCYIL